MDEFQQPEESIISTDDVAILVKDTVDSIIPRDADYSDEAVAEWIDHICETIMQRAAAMRKAFKFVVTVSISRKTGAGMHVASSAHWDITSDNLYCHKDETNKDFITLVTLYWSAI